MEEITHGRSIEKIKRFDERIQKLEAELPGSVKATRMKFTRPELEAPAAPSRLTDYFEFRKSIGAGSDANGDSSHDEFEESEPSEKNVGGSVAK
jgi:hypothetical protein